MKMKKWLPLFLVIAMVLGACSNKGSETNEKVENEDLDNVNESGMPIVEEPISLDIFAGKAFASGPNWNDIMIWNEYEEMTNVDVNWEMVPFNSMKEKRNLALASGDLPDAFHTALIPNLDLYKYGDQGTFIELNDLIDEYAPNLKKIFEEYPEVEKGLTFPDGNIYSFPTVFSPDFPSLLLYLKPWIREDWLETLDMDMPETTDEFYEYLKAVKEEDPNGNGEADEIPYGGESIDSLISWLRGSFGVGNRGVNYIDMDPETDEMRFYPTSDGYKEMLEYIEKLYSEGLIEKNIFTIEDEEYFANGSEDRYGSTVYNTPVELFAGDKAKEFTGIPALEGPHGDNLFTMVSSPLSGTSGFVITNENEHPAATVRWMDYFYSDEGSKLFFMGKEGETFEENEDGEIDYVDEIKNSPEGLTLDQELIKHLTWPGGGYPGIVKEDYFKGAESSESEIEATEKVEADLIDEVWPGFTYTVEENNKLNSVGTDIEKYVGEMKDKFITGDASFDEWDEYVETIEKMGLEDYMEIQETAYERYEEN